MATFLTLNGVLTEENALAAGAPTKPIRVNLDAILLYHHIVSADKTNVYIDGIGQPIAVTETVEEIDRMLAGRHLNAKGVPIFTPADPQYVSKVEASGAAERLGRQPGR